MKEKLLILQHVPHEHAGRYADAAQKNGIQVNVLRLWENSKISDLTQYQRLLIMGGPQSVYEPPEDFPSLNFEMETIKTFVQMRKPVFGVCLGCQLLAQALGGKVYQYSMGAKPFKETGFYSVRLSEQGKSSRLFRGFPESFEVFQWHGDVIDLPKGAVLLATSQNVQNQAFSYGNTTHGLLFHLEFTPLMVNELIRIDKEWLHKDNNVEENRIMEQAHKNEQKLKMLSEMLFNNWLRISG